MSGLGWLVQILAQTTAEGTVIKALAIAAITGISEEEAARRLVAEGYNELPSGGRRNIFIMALDVIREPMFLLLIAAGTLYLLLGDLEEALLLLMFVFVIMGITFYQERKTENALAALRDLSSPRARVIRDGEVKRIAGRDVVRGDILVIEEGDRVPADAVLFSSMNLSIDESLLTGESIPVLKVAREGVTTAQQLPDEFHELIEYGILASQRDPFDPMEKAIRQLGEHKLARTEHLQDNWQLVHSYPLSEKLLAMSHVCLLYT